MAHHYTKSDLKTGDITEARNGDLGVVVLEMNCIVYQNGDVDEMDTFTDDLFIDGRDRSGDIFKIYRDRDGAIGFTERYNAITVFSRQNGRKTKARAQELSDKYDPTKGKFYEVILRAGNRRCVETYLDPKEDYEIRKGPGKGIATGQMISDVDVALSEAPSMTVCGEIGIDRTLIPVPGTEHVFFIYNKYQEERHLDPEDIWHKESEPIVVIPEKNIRIYSQCLLVRMNDSGNLEKLLYCDYNAAKKYMNQMKLL